MWPFSAARAAKLALPVSPVEMMESLSGNWYYHLARPDERTAEGRRAALCGSAHIMQTGVPLATWGYHDHLNERYCKVCEEAAVAAGWGALIRKESTSLPG